MSGPDGATVGAGHVHISTVESVDTFGRELVRIRDDRDGAVIILGVHDAVTLRDFLTDYIGDKRGTKMKNPAERETLSVDAVAARLGIGRNSAYRAVARGEIPSIRLGKLLLIPRVAFEALLRGGAGSKESDRSGGPE